MADETGLHSPTYPSGYKSKAEIVSSNYEEGKPVYVIPQNIPEDSFEYWAERIKQDQSRKLETFGVDREGFVEFKSEKPLAFGLIGDPHSGNVFCNYDLFHSHLSLIKENPLFYAITGGDLTDSIFWGRGQHEQIENASDQQRYMLAALDWIGKNKIIAGYSGQHDQWSAERGVTIYQEWHKRSGAYYFEGPSVLKIKINDQLYTLVGNHNPQGNSIYNDTHGENRESKFGIQGADVYFGFDTHKKGVSSQVAKTVHGDMWQYYVKSGPYKYGDDYARYSGMTPTADNQLGAVWLVLYPDRHSVVVYKTAEEVNEAMKHYL